MRYLVFLFAFLISLSAAAAPPAPTAPRPAPKTVKATHIDIHADKDFTPAERAGIQKAADEWRKQTNGRADIKVTFDSKADGVPLLRVLAGSPFVDMLDEDTACGTGHGGCIMAMINTLGGVHNPKPTNGLLVMMIVDRAFDADHPGFFTRTVMHEFGHLLGMVHLKDPYAILAGENDDSNASENLTLTRPDISEFCRVNDCK